MTASKTRPPHHRASSIASWSEHGQRREHGRLDTPTGSWEPSPGLTSPGDLPLARAADLVLADWHRQVAAGQIARLTVEKGVSSVQRLVAYATASGVSRLADLDEDLLADWVFAPLKMTTRRGRQREAGKPPGVSTMHFRRSTVRQFAKTCRALGLDDRYLAADLDLPPRGDTPPSALSDTEMQRCRDTAPFSTHTTLLPAVLALAATGASTAEVAMARGCDVRLDERLIWAHGGNRRTFARWLPLDEWMVPHLQARIDYLAVHRADQGDQASLTYNGDPDVPYDRKQSAVCGSLRRILYLADITRPDVRPTSFAEWVAASTFAQTGRVEAVAVRLGLVSLDRAAFTVGYDWLDAHLHPGPDATDR